MSDDTDNRRAKALYGISTGATGEQLDEWWETFRWKDEYLSKAIAIRASDEAAWKAAGLVLVPKVDIKEIEALFRWYGDLHAAKPDMDKAKRNYDMADKVKAMIAAHEGGDGE